MASDSQVERVIFESVAQEQLAYFNTIIRDSQEELQRLRAELAAGTISQGQFAQATHTAATRLADAKISANSLGDQLNRNAAGMRGWSQNITAAGYALNDFVSVSGDMGQRLTAIANNLPMLLAGFGNLGLTLSGVVPIIGIVLRHWEDLKALFMEGLTDIRVATSQTIDSLRKEVEELEKKKPSLGIDTLALDAAKAKLDALIRAQETLNRLTGQQTEFERESGKAIEDALIATGKFEEIRTKLGQQIAAVADSQKTRDLRDQLQKMEEELRGIEAAPITTRALPQTLVREQFLRSSIEETRTKAMESVREHNQQSDLEAGKIVDEAIRGRGQAQLAAQRKLQEKLRAIQVPGAREVAGEIEGKTPEGDAFGITAEAMEADRKFDEAMEKRQRDAQFARERRQERNERLTQQGEQQARDAEAEAAEIAKQQQAVIAPLQEQPRVRAFSERAAEDARKRGLEGADLFLDVQRRLYDAFTEELGKDTYKAQGIAPTGEAVREASRQLATQALGATAQKRTKQEEESIKGSGLTDAAITALAQGRQQGGFADRRGRFQPMTVDQQFNAVLQQVIQSLAAHNPRMDADRVRDLATRIVTDARTQMEAMQQQAIQAQLGLGPEIARAMQASQGNPAAFQQQMAQMMQQAMMANNANQIAMMQPMMNAQPNLINQMNQVGLDRVINRNRQAPQEGFRSVPPSTPVPGAGNGQAEAPTALLDRTLGAVGQEQAVVSGMQQVMGRLSAQLNQVVANVQKLQRNNGQLMTRNEPRQSTALDFSGRFA